MHRTVQARNKSKIQSLYIIGFELHTKSLAIQQPFQNPDRVGKKASPLASKWEVKRVSVQSGLEVLS